MIVCAGDIEQFSFAHPVGIGLINSAINLTRLALLDKPEFLIFAGTAGSYGEYRPFDIVESRASSNIEICFFEDRCYTPIDNVITSDGINVSHETIVNSSNYITTDSTVGKFFNKHNIGIENMEFFSVMSVGKEFDIPCGGIFVVTNYCGPDAHKEFKRNHRKAMRLLNEYIYEKYPGLKGMSEKDNS
ncbi:purine-nucleoside phosphorylase [Nitrosophilus alvini]|uniref:phosphorylase family protein n=1 Tax=Nitrosophilus alvini TaxID=2714855 RepID=UPI00190E06E4|nr:purine-nucleoside phosphorylase [Nitrosophilus alvini]